MEYISRLMLNLCHDKYRNLPFIFFIPKKILCDIGGFK